MGLKATYVRFVRGLRTLLARGGVLARLECSRNAALRHLRTLFAIYDAEDLARLDLPWWSYGAIHRVERFLVEHPTARVFEFGSGASTVWLARRASAVVTVEHDEAFAEVVQRLIQGYNNVELSIVPGAVSGPEPPATPSRRRGAGHLDFTRYVETIERVGGEFDLIVIDGRARLHALAHARHHVARGGLIVFDDAERRRYRPMRRLPGFDIQLFRGFGPCLPVPTATAVLSPR